MRICIKGSKYLPSLHRAERSLERGDILAELTQRDRAEAAAFNGTRKLIRPHLPMQERRRDGGYSAFIEDPLTHAMAEPHTASESSHAEAFYFQKQMQMQTEM